MVDSCETEIYGNGFNYQGERSRKLFPVQNLNGDSWIQMIEIHLLRFTGNCKNTSYLGI